MLTDIAVELLADPLPAHEPTVVVATVPDVWDSTPAWIGRFLACVRQHESHGNYRAENPVSTASGAYQYLDSTWRGVAKWVRVNGRKVAVKYPRASAAPAWVQDAAAIHTVTHGGLLAWRGTSCGYGT